MPPSRNVTVKMLGHLGGLLGELMGEAARASRPMSAPDGMIVATARVHSAPLATRSVAGFRETGVVLVDPRRG